MLVPCSVPSFHHPNILYPCSLPSLPHLLLLSLSLCSVPIPFFTSSLFFPLSQTVLLLCSWVSVSVSLPFFPRFSQYIYSAPYVSFYSFCTPLPCFLFISFSLCPAAHLCIFLQQGPALCSCLTLHPCSPPHDFLFSSSCSLSFFLLLAVPQPFPHSCSIPHDRQMAHPVCPSVPLVSFCCFSLPVLPLPLPSLCSVPSFSVPVLLCYSPALSWSSQHLLLFHPSVLLPVTNFFPKLSSPHTSHSLPSILSYFFSLCFSLLLHPSPLFSSSCFLALHLSLQSLCCIHCPLAGNLSVALPFIFFLPCNPLYFILLPHSVLLPVSTSFLSKSNTFVRSVLLPALSLLSAFLPVPLCPTTPPSHVLSLLSPSLQPFFLWFCLNLSCFVFLWMQLPLTLILPLDFSHLDLCLAATTFVSPALLPSPSLLSLSCSLPRLLSAPIHVHSLC